MKIRWERWNKKKKARKFLVLEEIALTVRQIIVKSIFAPFFRTGVTNQRENKTYYKVTPTRHIHTGTHIQAGSRHSQKEKKSWTQNYLLKENDKKMFRPSTTTTTTTRLLAGNSRSKNHDTNTNEM